MCSLRKGVTVLLISVEDMFVTLELERCRPSSSGRSRLQFWSLLEPALRFCSLSAGGMGEVLWTTWARWPTR